MRALCLVEDDLISSTIFTSPSANNKNNNLGNFTKNLVIFSPKVLRQRIELRQDRYLSMS